MSKITPNVELALSLLKHYWGFDGLRPNQLPIIQKVLAGENVVAILPTGGGKSICFQLPALCLKGLTIVVSPLVALMEDQVSQLLAKGIHAAAIHSGLSSQEFTEILFECQSGNLKLLYCSPERLRSDEFRSAIRDCSISLVAVDEAHCISQWGYDFRPDYLRIIEFLNFVSKVQVIALTASATPEVLLDITKQLEISEECIIRNSFARDNLGYQVQRSENKSAAVFRVCKQTLGSGILYCQTRGECLWWSDYLVQKGVNAAPYHAGLSHELKMKTYQKWMLNELKLVCATSAFGMGIDKPDVRFVLHVQMPLQPEAYFQEAGRAGRDGKAAFSRIFWNEEDVSLAKQRLHLKFPEISWVSQCYEWICAFCEIQFYHPRDAVFEFDAIAFCSIHKINPWSLQGAMKILENRGYLALDLDSFNFTELRVISSPEVILEFVQRECPESMLIRCLMGMYGKLFERMTRVNEFSVAAVMKLSIHEVQNLLRSLASMGMISLRHSTGQTVIKLLQARVRTENLCLESVAATDLLQRDLRRAECMYDYLRSNQCRSRFLLQYFGEAQSPECGVCDVCLSKEIGNKEMLMEYIKTMLPHHPVTMYDLKNLLYKKGWKKEYGLWLRELLDDGSFLLNQNHCIELRD